MNRFGWLDYVIGLWLLVLLIVAGMLLGGCAGSVGSGIPNSLPAVGSGIERTGVHVESAERLNRAAKPLAGPTARPLMDQVSEEHGAAKAAIAETKVELRAANEQRTILEDTNRQQANRIIRVESGWGYRLQLWVNRFAWGLLGASVLHVALGGAALFVPGRAGAVLAKLGVATNPFAWFQSIRDNYWFRVKATPTPLPVESRTASRIFLPPTVEDAIEGLAPPTPPRKPDPRYPRLAD